MFFGEAGRFFPDRRKQRQSTPPLRAGSQDVDHIARLSRWIGGVRPIGITGTKPWTGDHDRIDLLLGKNHYDT
ncbi:hypothetical protein [Amycolatopsis taiwanensis]|uniref:hypothetical protein n=1 Tax=Amycolatopsis taiwanensis TaxID=342230 RepID=UPI002555115F|nr:hypothetical protein [Amycolatopsis taiwanensis]